MTAIKHFVMSDNLGPDFEQDATAKEIKVNDVPQQSGFPKYIEWPVKPETISS